MKRILLTGSTGFIGRNLLDLLSGRYEVLSPTRRELDLLDDGAVRAYMRRHPVDAIVHCATTPARRNASIDSVTHKNLRMFLNLAQNEDCWRRFIQLGSGAEYDMRHYRPKMKEDYFGAHIPADEHGFSKSVISRMIEASDRMVNLRLFGVFGKHEDYEIRFISNAICKTLTGRPITLKQNRRFDYLFVEDLPAILEHFIENPARHKAYNVTPDESVELLWLAELVRNISDRPVPIEIAQPGLGVEYSGDNSRLRAELPSLGLTDIAAAVRRLFDWYAGDTSFIRQEALLEDK